MEKIAIIVDAACDLPSAFVAKNNIFVVPFHVVTQKGVVQDDRDPGKTADLYKTHLQDQSEDYAHTVPLMPDELESFFLSDIVLNYDSAVFITLAASRSEMNKNIHAAWFGISTKCFKLRREHGIKGGFNLEIIDSASLGPGQGLLAYAAVAAVQANAQLGEIKQFLMQLRRNIYIYGVPDDLLYMYTRAKAKNEKSITWGKYTLATMLGVKPILKFHLGQSAAVGRTRSLSEAIRRIGYHLKDKIEEGVRVRVINLSYSGNIDDVHSLSDYQSIVTLAQSKGIEVLLSQMSLTVAINLGTNALLVAFAADSSEFND